MVEDRVIAIADVVGLRRMLVQDLCQSHVLHRADDRVIGAEAERLDRTALDPCDDGCPVRQQGGADIRTGPNSEDLELSALVRPVRVEALAPEAASNGPDGEVAAVGLLRQTS